MQNNTTFVCSGENVKQALEDAKKEFTNEVQISSAVCKKLNLTTYRRCETGFRMSNGKDFLEMVYKK